MNETQVYDIEELRSFFVPHHMDAALHTGELDNLSNAQIMEKMLTYYEIDQQFPVEILKKENPECIYVMYPVAQGGFYYVFLSRYQPTKTLSQMPEKMDLYVRFTAYLGDADSNGEYSSLDFLEIKPGVTTMLDVLKSDPYAEPIFLSGGIYTCSLLDDSTVLQVQYQYKQDDNRPDHIALDLLVATEASIKEIENSASIFAEILGN